MSSRRRPTLLLLAAALSVILMSGCFGGANEPDGDGDVIVGAESASVQLAEGEVLVVELGEVNSGAGATWEPDAAVLGPGRWVNTYAGDEDPPPPGTPSTLANHLDAVGPGVTTIEFQYNVRGESMDPPRGPGRIVLEVTVT